MGDVLGTLLDAIAAGTALAWVLEHRADVHDPLPAAWAACTDGWTMYRVAKHVVGKREFGSPPFCRWHAWGLPSAARRPRWDTCPDCIAGIRAKLPTVTLRDVLGVSRDGRG